MKETEIMKNCNTFNAMPEGLSHTGQKAYRKIVKTLTKAGATFTGGCKTFYSPQEWADRGEEYGQGAELIVVYDGGDVRAWFSCDHGSYQMQEKMREALKKVGVYAEECTCWYSAVYKD